MYSFANRVNKDGVVFSKSRLYNKKVEMVKEYGRCCDRLYALGYLPSRHYDERSFMECFFDEYKDVYKLFRNRITGEIVLDERQLKYAARKLSNEVLDYAYRAVHAEYIVSQIDALMDGSRVPKKSDTFKYRAKISIAYGVDCASRVDFMSLIDCLYRPDGTDLARFCYLTPMLEKIVGQKVGNQSVLLGDGFTVEDDCYYLDKILVGDIETFNSSVAGLVDRHYGMYDGRDGSTVFPSLFKKYWGMSSELISRYTDAHMEDCFFYDRCFIYALRDSVIKDSPRTVYVGTRVSGIGSVGVSQINSLYGFSGGFLYHVGPNIDRFHIHGTPVYLLTDPYDGKCEKVPYYPSLSVDGAVEWDSPTVVDAEEMCEFLCIDSIDDLDTEVVGILDGGDAEFNRLVGLMVQTLVCIACDYILEGHDSPNQLVLERDVSDEEYLKACIKAVETYKEIMR